MVVALLEDEEFLVRRRGCLALSNDGLWYPQSSCGITPRSEPTSSAMLNLTWNFNSEASVVGLLHRLFPYHGLAILRRDKTIIGIYHHRYIRRFAPVQSVIIHSQRDPDSIPIIGGFSLRECLCPNMLTQLEATWR
jgi:hypothetical protein